jgi:hypothetical protein
MTLHMDASCVLVSHPPSHPDDEASFCWNLLDTQPSQTRVVQAATVVAMNEARAVLQRLDRIEELERRDAPAGDLLVELRGLVSDAEAWLRVEPETHGAVEALAGCRGALEVDDPEVALLVR